MTPSFPAVATRVGSDQINCATRAGSWHDNPTRDLGEFAR